MIKRSYHSDFILQYKLGLLPPEIVKKVPSSTRSYWNKNDYSRLIGNEYMMLDKEDNLKMIRNFATNKKLEKAAKALYFTFCTYVDIVGKISATNKQLKNHKLKVVQAIERTRQDLGINRALKLWGISKNQYYAWKNVKKCTKSAFDLCIKKFSNQLTFKEVGVIKKYLKDPKFKQWSNSAIYYQMLRDKAAFMAKSTFFRYAHRLNLMKPKIKKPNYPIGLRVDTPKKMLHMDVTIFKPNDHTKVYLYVLMDNYSRFILNVTASSEYSANICFKNIKEAYERYNLKSALAPIELICDGGPENKGKLQELLACMLKRPNLYQLELKIIADYNL